MLTFFTSFHVLICVFMTFIILLQPGKEDGMGAAFGGGGSASAAFGGRGAVTFLSKLTAICGVIFFITSLGLSFVGLKSSVAAGIMEETPAAAAPLAPGATAPSKNAKPASTATGTTKASAAPSTQAAPTEAPAKPAGPAK